MALARHLSCFLTLEWSSRTREGLPLPPSGEVGSLHRTKPVLPGAHCGPLKFLARPPLEQGRPGPLNRLPGRWASLSS